MTKLEALSEHPAGLLPLRGVSTVANPYRGRGSSAYQRAQQALKRRCKAQGIGCANCGKPFDFDNHNSKRGFTADHPEALARTIEIAQACDFSLDELKYEYPDEPVPPGKSAIQHLRDLTWEGASWRFEKGMGEKERRTLEHELDLIEAWGERKSCEMKRSAWSRCSMALCNSVMSTSIRSQPWHRPSPPTATSRHRAAVPPSTPCSTSGASVRASAKSTSRWRALPIVPPLCSTSTTTTRLSHRQNVDFRLTSPHAKVELDYKNFLFSFSISVFCCNFAPE